MVRAAGRTKPRGKLHRTARRVLGGSPANGAHATFPFAVTDEERRYLESNCDDRTPLPPGAANYLSADNPRLLELQRRYASLDLPALSHHLWNADRVAHNVDLRYFRGDNLYVWHYPEHPRAMALKLFLYMRHLEEQGGRELLDGLAEDGAFGCWTTEVSGYGKVSRDLLDSVNETLFLDRHLGLLTRPNLRVLDIGAGYGRLGHRLAEAAPGLVDYCCVDAVPESTFLANFYLNFRGSSPPARAVALDEVPDLQPGAFELAINVHSFSECTIEAIRWWIGQLRRLEVPKLFVVPNEADGIVSRELDGSYHSVLPALEAAGYVQIAKERAISDRATRDALMLNENFYLFSLQ
jgi:putative sugar O-methyltransferase